MPPQPQRERSSSAAADRNRPAPSAQSAGPAQAAEAGRSRAAWNSYMGQVNGARGAAEPAVNPAVERARAEARSAIPGLHAKFPSLAGGGADRAPAEELAASTAASATAPAPAPATRAPHVGGGGPTVGGGGDAAETLALDEVPREPAQIQAGTRAGRLYDGHDANVGHLSSKLTPAQAEDVSAFQSNWHEHRGRYEAVSAKTGIPAPLIAALHWRESTANFNTYLHQGDPLGKKAVHVPRDIPVFHVWEDAAVHALTQSDKAELRDDLGMDEGTRDTAAMASFAEAYNGLGYHNKGKASPYVYSGTSAYTGGKYVRDGRYNPRVKDQQVGVVALIGSINGMDSTIQNGPTDGPAGWASLEAGRTLQPGQSGPLVGELQRRLALAGFPCGQSSTYDAKVEQAVRAFEKAQGLPEDGVVGPEVAKKLPG